MIFGAKHLTTQYTHQMSPVFVGLSAINRSPGSFFESIEIDRVSTTNASHMCKKCKRYTLAAFILCKWFSEVISFSFILLFFLRLSFCPRNRYVFEPKVLCVCAFFLLLFIYSEIINFYSQTIKITALHFATAQSFQFTKLNRVQLIQSKLINGNRQWL